GWAAADRSAERTGCTAVALPAAGVCGVLLAAGALPELLARYAHARARARRLPGGCVPGAAIRPVEPYGLDERRQAWWPRPLRGRARPGGRRRVSAKPDEQLDL